MKSHEYLTEGRKNFFIFAADKEKEKTLQIELMIDFYCKTRRLASFIE